MADADVVDSSCEFCRIASGDGPAEVVFRDGAATAFLDLNPINPGHILVVPNSHVTDFEQLSPTQLAQLMPVVQTMAKAVKAIYSPKKVGLAVAGFDVSHVHVHVIPLHDYHDLTSKPLLDGTLKHATASELATNGARIRNAIAAHGASNS